MKKIVVMCSLVFVLLLTMSTVFAINCGGGYFDYDSDYGTWLPGDDVRGYTSTYAYGHSGTYVDYLTAYVRIDDNGDYVEVFCDDSNVAQCATGWYEWSNHDHGTVSHLAIADCNYTYCVGYASLNTYEVQ